MSASLVSGAALVTTDVKMNRKFPPLSQAPAAAAVFPWMHGPYAVRSLRVARGLTQARSAAGSRGPKKALAGALRCLLQDCRTLSESPSVALLLHTCLTLSLSYTHAHARTTSLPTGANPCSSVELKPFWGLPWGPPTRPLQQRADTFPTAQPQAGLPSTQQTRPDSLGF